MKILLSIWAGLTLVWAWAACRAAALADGVRRTVDYEEIDGVRAEALRYMLKDLED